MDWAADLERTPRDRARGLLRECRSLSERLVESIDAQSSGRVHKDLLSPSQVMVLLLDKQKKLRSVVEEIERHQRIQQTLQNVLRLVAQEDARLARLSACLRGAEASLQSSLDETKHRLSALHRSNKGYIEVDNVVAYASKISGSVSAPPNWDPASGASLGKNLPPAPPDEMMRTGKLASMALQPSSQL